MTFDEVLAQVIELLRREGRLSYRALKRRFSLDDEYLEDLKTEIIDAKRLAVDENGTVLVWAGAAETMSAPRDNPQTESRAAPATSVSDEGQRRQLTVMFCDLVSSTALSEQFDPEELRDLIRAYQHACSAVITRFDGRIAKYLGDGLLAYFGYPRAHEDDARRAVRAALGILAAMEALNAEHSRHPLLQTAYVPDSFARLRSAPPREPPPYQKMQNGTASRKPVSLKVRLGVHTGLVVVGEMGSSDFREQAAIVGDTPNTADRLQELAEPDTVVISGATYQLVRGLFDCEALGPRALKGISTPIQVYRVLRESNAHSRFDVAMQTGLTPLVGRENESAILSERWERVRNGEGQAVLLSGEPGIGKSRLVEAFRGRIAAEPRRWVECHCSPYYQNSALSPIIDLLQRTLAFRTSDEHSQKLDRLESELKRFELPLPDYVPLFAPLLSLPVPDKYPPLTLTPEAQKEKIHLAIQAWLLAIAEQGGLVVVFEDLHWADPSTLELLGPLLDQVPTTRLLLVLTYRPEFAPPWPVRSHFVTIALSRLPRPQSETVVRNVSGGKPLPAQVLDQIISKTDGVPLFVEELTKAVLESDLLREHNDRYELTGPLPPLAIPSTLHDSLTARLDRLGSVREVAQLAATIGRDFSYELLRAICPLDDSGLRSAMAALVDAEVLYRRGIMPQARYFFKHALIRDAAYESLLRSRRQQVHARIARVLEEQFLQAAVIQPELVAHHYTEAGLRSQAMPYWQKSGEQALKRSAFVESINHFTKALDLLPECSGDGELEQQRKNEELQCALLLAIGEAQRRGGQPLRAQQSFIRAADVAQALFSAELVGEAALQLTRLVYGEGLPVAPIATRLFEDALERIGSQDTPLRATVLGGLSISLASVGAKERAIEYGRQAVTSAGRLGDFDAMALGHCGICYALQLPEHAHQRLAEATEMLHAARRSESKELVQGALLWRWYSLFELGDVDAAKKDLLQYFDWIESRREPFLLCLAKNSQACEASLEGRFEDFERLALEALSIGQSLETEHAAGIFGVQMFTLRREQGRLHEVEPLLRHFVQTSEDAHVWRPGLALIYSELGRAVEARQIFEQLAALDFAEVPRDANWLVCMSYLTDVCTFLGDPNRALTLYDMLQPYRGINILIANWSACYGSASRFLGALATVMARWHEAELHFEDAITMNSAMGARPWLAHTQYQYARMLISRDQPGDSDKAATLLKEALTTARELGMRALEQRITSGAP